MKRKTSSLTNKVSTSIKQERAVSARSTISLQTPSPVVGEGGGEGLVLSAGATPDLYHSIATILRAARTNAYRSINFTMVEAYWNVGRSIVEDEQQGQTRAEYGAQLIQRLADRLCAEFGKGYSVQSLWNMRQFH
jgi:hypothetical protein